MKQIDGGPAVYHSTGSRKSVGIYICAYTYKRDMYMCIYIYSNLYMYLYICIYMHIHMYIHTYI